MNIPNFATKDELFKFLIDNKSVLEAEKKATMKFADGIGYIQISPSGDEIIKANQPFIPDADNFKVIVVINTTKIMDSHYDVHIDGLWTKTLKENKDIMHLQEHQLKFDKIISDGNDLKAYTKTFNWSELGFKFDGQTEALVFDSTIKKERNPFMFEQYSKAYVKQHSVGMRYVKIVLCVNSDEEYYGAEKEAWDKYFPMVANKDYAESIGYFWAVKEAKVIEGSAVPIGSNYATPTLENNKFEPSEDTQKEPQISTQELRELISNNLKTF